MRQPALLIVACVAILGCSEGTAPFVVPTPTLASLTITSGDQQSGVVASVLPQQIEVRALGNDGRGMAGLVVNFGILSGFHGSVTPSNAVTDSAGIARVTWTLGQTAGEDQRLLAQVNATDVKVEAHAQARAGAPFRIVKKGGDLQGGEVGVPLRDSVDVVVLDVFANVVPGAKVSWTVIEGSVDFSTTNSVTNNNGSARTSVTMRGLRPVVVSASIGYIGPVQFNSSVQFYLHANPAHSSNLRFSSISAGGNYTCAVSTAARGYCWGDDRFLELGIEVDTIINDPHATTQWSYPIEVAGNLRFRKIDTDSNRGDHTCAITTDNELYCWGRNWEGQLGVGAAPIETGVPLRVAPGLSFSDVAVGNAFTCALTVPGQAFCWGLNGAYGLGNGTTLDANVPQAVNTSLRFKSIYAGAAHTCALTADGSAWCWGRDGGELHAQTPCGSGLCATVPMPLFPDMKFSMLTRDAFCGIAIGGAAYCWGQAANGAIGNGQKDSTTVIVATPVAGNHSFLAIDGGVADHRCGLTTSNDIFCWGWDSGGTLAPGPETCGSRSNVGPCSSTPLRVDSSIPFASLSAGSTHNCAISMDLVAYCWGSNFLGALGTADPSVRTHGPLRVADQ